MSTKDPSNSMGVPYQRVMVKDLSEDRSFAICQNQAGATVNVPTTIRSGKGGWPRIGEVWLITRETGAWTFAAIYDDKGPPVITASRVGAPPLVVQLFDALIRLGLVEAAANDPYPDITEGDDSSEDD